MLSLFILSRAHRFISFLFTSKYQSIISICNIFNLHENKRYWWSSTFSYSHPPDDFRVQTLKRAVLRRAWFDRWAEREIRSYKLFMTPNKQIIINQNTFSKYENVKHEGLMGFRLSRNKITNAIREKRVKCVCVWIVIFFKHFFWGEVGSREGLNETFPSSSSFSSFLKTYPIYNLNRSQISLVLWIIMEFPPFQLLWPSNWAAFLRENEKCIDRGSTVLFEYLKNALIGWKSTELKHHK